MVISHRGQCTDCAHVHAHIFADDLPIMLHSVFVDGVDHIVIDLQELIDLFLSAFIVHGFLTGKSTILRGSPDRLTILVVVRGRRLVSEHRRLRASGRQAIRAIVVGRGLIAEGRRLGPPPIRTIGIVVGRIGRIPAFDDWAERVQPYVNHQNRAWLRTEFDTAAIRAHNEADWQRFREDADVYPYLEWIPSTSSLSTGLFLQSSIT